MSELVITEVAALFTGSAKRRYFYVPTSFFLRVQPPSLEFDRLSSESERVRCIFPRLSLHSESPEGLRPCSMAALKDPRSRLLPPQSDSRSRTNTKLLSFGLKTAVNQRVCLPVGSFQCKPRFPPVRKGWTASFF